MKENTIGFTSDDIHNFNQFKFSTLVALYILE